MFRTTTLIIDEKMLQRLIRKQEELNRERARLQQTSAHLHHPMSVDGHETSSPFGPRPQAS